MQSGLGGLLAEARRLESMASNQRSFRIPSAIPLFFASVMSFSVTGKARCACSRNV